MTVTSVLRFKVQDDDRNLRQQPGTAGPYLPARHGVCWKQVEPQQRL